MKLVNVALGEFLYIVYGTLPLSVSQYLKAIWQLRSAINNDALVVYKIPWLQTHKHMAHWLCR